MSEKEFHRNGAPPRAILWDLDGVLVDTAAAHFQAWKTLFQGLGKTFTEEDFRRTFGQRNESILPAILGPLSDQDMADLARRKEDLVIPHLRSVTVFPEAIALVRRAREAGTPQAIVTSTPRRNLETVLAGIRLADAFQALVTGEDVQRGKPDPEGYLLAARQVGHAPQDCVVVEDAPAGVEAAVRAGMRCIAVTTSNPRERLQEATLVVDTLGDRAVEAFLGLGRRRR